MRHFTIEELTTTDTGFKNVPNQEQESNLIALVDNVLDPARELLNAPVKVNSGFRCRVVNDAVKGAKNSSHLKGEAADLDCFDNRKLFEIIRDNLPFDQLINEYNFSWIHVSFSRLKNRKQILNIV